MRKYLGFVISDKEYAIDLEKVKQVSLIVEIMPVPERSFHILGLINVQGEITPVINLRSQLGLPEKAPELTDQLIIIQHDQRLAAIVVDKVTGIIPVHKENSVLAKKLMPKAELLDVVIKEGSEFILGLTPQKWLEHPEYKKMIREEHEAE